MKISGVAFSEKAPYFKSMPDEVKKKVFIASEMLITINGRGTNVPKSYDSYGNDYHKTGFDKKTGGYIVQYKLHGKIKPHENIAYDILMKNGFQIELPEKPKQGKHPDTITNGIVRELKSFMHTKNLQRSLSNEVQEKSEQANDCIFHIAQQYNTNDIVDGLLGGFKKIQSAKSVVMIINNTTYLLSREYILSGTFRQEFMKKIKADEQ